MVTSIGYSLGAGSGLDIKALVDGLAAAARAPKENLIAKREAANQASISALGEVSSAIDGFAAALSQLISGGTLFTQPSVSDPDVLTAAAVAGSDIGGLSAKIEVQQLARAQSLVSANLAASDPVGQGDLVLVTSAGSFTVTIDGSNDSLTGLAKAINDKQAGVTATVLTDSGGARLMLKGATGETGAFTLGVAAGTTSGLERFAYDPAAPGGMTAAQVALDAIVRLDGVEVRRSTNSFGDLVAGVQIDLVRAAPGTIVSLGATRPSAAIKQAVSDFVGAYNELHAMLAEATAPASAKGEAGALRGDLSIRDLQRQLARLTSTVLSSGTGPSTLAEIGVATNRDGTLSINETQLDTALERDPGGVEALFNPRQHSSDPLVTIFSKMGAAKPGTYTLTDLVPAGGGAGASGKVNGLAMISSGPHLISPASSPAVGLVVEVLGNVANATIIVDSGLGGALLAIRDAVRARSGPIVAAQQRLAAEAKSIASERDAMEARAATYYNQLVASFTTMEKQVSAFKATQSYLDQQIKAWTGDND